ncbi:hypothetical protein SCHPADRAFT_280498 [Schizopora paradoxa]|uniref:Uncharacterized protein n=1 Tax=Schizopora paradoxa TaxID=27342 RepID=A0A0H2SDN0_9AGAM|nr:hypothetical protein SCHPADRAFT_280498 [Schizopora paradoxa]
MSEIPADSEESGLLQLKIHEVLETFKESRLKHQDTQNIWCPRWATAKETADKNSASKIQNAKTTLLKLKAIKNALITIVDSLDETIELVTEESSNIIRVAGFSSLPDDVLARIFEMNHWEYKKEAEIYGLAKKPQNVCSSNVLAQVCQRFRRIILHIPCLWDIISNTQDERWISIAKDRSENLSLFVSDNVARAKTSIADFLRRTSPTSQWKELHARFMGRKQCVDFIDRVPAISGAHLPCLESLSLQIDWDWPKIYSYGEDRDDPDEGDGFRSTTKSNSLSLSAWKLPELKHLTVKNFIPVGMHCPALQACHIELTGSRRIPHRNWDLHALKGFLGCLSLVESLSFSFSNACTPKEDEFAKTKQVEFPRLKSLSIAIRAETQEEFLRSVMDMMDVTTLSNLAISMIPDESGYLQSRIQQSFRAIFRRAVFKNQSSTMPIGSMVRKFPNVETFSLNLMEQTAKIHCDMIFDALPRAQGVILELPRCSDLGLPLKALEDPSEVSDDTSEAPRDLSHSSENLRHFHLKNCNAFNNDSVLKFLKGRGRKIEKVKIEGCYNLRRFEGDLKEMLGDKFVWKG